MKRILAVSLVTLAATGFYFGLPNASQASGISFSIGIGTPAPYLYQPVYRPYVAPAPVTIFGSYYSPAPRYAVVPPYAAYPAPVILPAPVYRPAYQPAVILPPARPAHYRYYR